MSLERVTLRHEQETMLMTLYLHARDARAPEPVLGDQYAGPILDRVDYDFDRLSSIAGNQPVIVSRAKAIDEIVRSFLGKHEDAVVLHLGCGLDTRVQRIAPGSAVSWFDVDQAPVIELRRRLVDDRPGTTMLATSVIDKGWWTAVPENRPTLIVGEGLLMYLAPKTFGFSSMPPCLVASRHRPWCSTPWRHGFVQSAGCSETSERPILDSIRLQRISLTPSRGMHRFS